MQKVDLTLTNVATFQEELDQINKRTKSVALKKDIKELTEKITHCATKTEVSNIYYNFERFASKTTLNELSERVEAAEEYSTKLVKNIEMKDKLTLLSREIWEELNKKHETRVFD